MSRKTVLIVAPILIAVAAGIFAVQRFVVSHGLPEGLIQANGRIEGDHITIASKFSGRVQELLAREGDTVHAGQVLVRLDDVQTRTRVEQARRGFEALESQVQAAHASLAVLNLEVPLAIETADAGISSARAAVDQARAVEVEARRDVERMRPLIAEQAVSRQQVDQAEARWSVAKSEITTARSRLTQAVKELAQVELGWKRIRTKENEVAAWERQRDQGEAALAEAESILADLTIVAPTSGTITTRMVDTGEVVIAGAPLLELMNLDRLYLKVYIPEIEIGKVRLDLPARIYTLTPSRISLSMRWSAAACASKAEFAPKEIQTRDERVKLSMSVKLYLTVNPGSSAHAGSALPMRSFDGMTVWCGEAENSSKPAVSTQL